jgi:chromosome transmission fidelity protein 8
MLLLQGKPTLRIGYHLLEGTIVSLAKPLAVLQRVPTPSRSQIPPPPNPDAMHCRDDGGEELGALGPVSTTATMAATSYAIRTIVRKKIVFSKRPTPMVGTSAKIGMPADG